MKVLMIKPNEEAYVTDIGTSLEEMQSAVQGYIEVYYPFDDVCLICNEEGKINGMEPNRIIFDESNGSIKDIIYGPFFLCNSYVTGLDTNADPEDEFGSLRQEQIEKYLKYFK